MNRSVMRRLRTASTTGSEHATGRTPLVADLGQWSGGQPAGACVLRRHPIPHVPKGRQSRRCAPGTGGRARSPTGRACSSTSSGDRTASSTDSLWGQWDGVGEGSRAFPDTGRVARRGASRQPDAGRGHAAAGELVLDRPRRWSSSEPPRTSSRSPETSTASTASDSRVVVPIGRVKPIVDQGDAAPSPSGPATARRSRGSRPHRSLTLDRKLRRLPAGGRGPVTLDRVEVFWPPRLVASGQSRGVRCAGGYWCYRLP